ncbi:MAG: MOSC domain-containing protein [Bacteroidota bacterium]
MKASVTAVSKSGDRDLAKANQASIFLLAGLGVEGDAHAKVGKNLRQVHLLPAELHDELQHAGFPVSAGQMGENVTTRGIDLVSLSNGTRLHLGETAVVELTGLRAPCKKLETIKPGLLKAVFGPGNRPKAGVMGIVIIGGLVRPGDPIRIEEPASFRALEPI